VLFAAYAATLGLDAFPGTEYAGDEPHYLLAAHSIVHDGDLDVADEYRASAYRAFYPFALDQHGVPRGGRLHEPHGAGFPALIAPAYALAGARAVELFLAALAALGGALAYLLARRAAPDPWAFLAALAVGLSPPLLAYGGAVYPELTAGAVLSGAALLALRLGTAPGGGRGAALGCFALLATLPWLGTKFVPAGAVVGVFALRALWRSGRRSLVLGGLALSGAVAIAYVLANRALYGGPSPYAADAAGRSATGADFPLGHLDRAYRLGALLIDRDYGVVRWAPVLALALVGAWLVIRARRRPGSASADADGRTLSARGALGAGGRTLPEPDARAAAGLCAAAAAAQLAVAAFLAPTMFGFWFPGRHLVAGLPLAVPLVALGLARLPRAGAVLIALTAAASAWLYADLRLAGGTFVYGLPPAPWGPLEGLFPFFGPDPFAYALTAAAGSALVLLALLEARHWRQAAGPTRARYSG
jgi:hypothetical protein